MIKKISIIRISINIILIYTISIIIPNGLSWVLSEDIEVW